MDERTRKGIGSSESDEWFTPEHEFLPWHRKYNFETDPATAPHNPQDYAGSHPNKKIGLQLGAKAGDVIWYFKTDDKKSSVSIKQEDIGIRKYKEMLMNVVKDALEIMGHGNAEKIESEIFGIVRKPKKRKGQPIAT
jgi:hypothetical protein